MTVGVPPAGATHFAPTGLRSFLLFRQHALAQAKLKFRLPLYALCEKLEKQRLQTPSALQTLNLPSLATGALAIFSVTRLQVLS